MSARDDLLDAIAARQQKTKVSLDGALLSSLRVFVRTASVTEIYKAFGAPGDFGYETAVGDALSRLYREGVAS